jgi:hypothetical protein
VGQRVLEAVFGDSAVRSLAARAREDLIARADQLFRWEQDRFDARLGAAAPPPGAADGLRGAAAVLTVARRAAT